MADQRQVWPATGGDLLAFALWAVTYRDNKAAVENVDAWVSRLAKDVSAGRLVVADAVGVCDAG
jgi:hypothetical protein